MKLPYRWDDATVDVATALITGGLGLWQVVLRARLGAIDGPLWPELTVQILGSAALLARRRAPALVLAVCVALSLVFPVIATPVALHAVSRYTKGLRLATAVFVGTLLAVFPVWYFTSRKYGIMALSLLVLIAVVSWVLGRAQRASYEVAALRIAHERADREQLAQDIRDAERANISREMHDVVAHRISLIVLQANLLDTETDDPAIHEGLNQLRLTGRAALDEMREVLGLLKRGDLTERSQDITHQSLSDVQELAREARSVGQPVDVDLEVSSEPVPGLAERTAYRIVREALTNAVRHAPGAPTNVSVTEEKGALHVVVRNDTPQASPSGLTTGGNGLQGLRERVALIGGTITAEPAPRGGFLVDARLPRRDS